MAFQYIYTSARRGLEPGKSGFCCVARDRDLPVDLAKELERLSRYEHLSGQSSPLILRHLQITLRSGNYHILSRLHDSGVDYSKRNNHIAHHLAFTQDEAITLPDPATILLFWAGWKSAWKEPPRVLNEKDIFRIQDLNTTELSSHFDFEPAVADANPKETAFIMEEGQEYELAIHYRNSLLQLPVRRRWDVPFTTFILTSERPSQFTWRANWKGRELPFDLSPGSSSPIDEPTDEIREEPVPPEPAEPPSPVEAFKKFAPTVEIPEELDRAARRRPKRRWTRKRFSKALNLGLALVGALCLGMLAYFVYDYNYSIIGQSPSHSKEPSETDQVTSPQTELSLARNRWDALQLENDLLNNSDEVLELAQRIASGGDNRPLEIAQALNAIKTVLESAKGTPPIALISADLVQFERDQWLLDTILVSELSSLDFVLLPYPFYLECAQLNQLTDSGQTLVESLYRDRFSVEEAQISLNSVNRAARDSLSRNSVESIASAEDYLTLWNALQTENRLEGIQNLETVLKINGAEAFFATDDDGLLVSPERTDITNHLLQLYESFILKRFSAFDPTPEFQLALKEATQSFDSTIDAARAIYAVFVAATPTDPQLQRRLEAVRAEWKATFIRGDLMAETIINFNFERLATSKQELARLQSQFTRQTIRDLRDLSHIQAALKSAEAALTDIRAQSQWALLNRAAYLP